MQFEGISPDAWIQQEHIGTAQLADNQLKICWNGAASPNLPVMRLNLIAKEAIQLSKTFFIDETGLYDEAVSENDTYIYKVSLDFQNLNQSNVETNWIMHQNAPNPFHASTSIKVEIEQASPVVLRVFDVLGNEVHAQSRDFSVGINYFDLQAADLPKKGIYVYEVTTNFGKKTNRLLFMN